MGNRLFNFYKLQQLEILKDSIIGRDHFNLAKYIQGQVNICLLHMSTLPS